MSADARILMAHGGGGELTRQLIDERVLTRLANPLLDPLADSAILTFGEQRICLTTDSYVVTPLRFPGGDIGRLAVCGTINDLAVMGAEPVALTLALIVEEGLPLSTLDAILDSIAASAREAGVPIATGDTKVIERRTGEGLFINTAGVGHLRREPLDASRIAPGDAILLSGRMAEHGLAVISAREGQAFETDLRSDVAALHGLAAALADSGAELRFMRDPTRGGVAGVLADLRELTGLSIDIREEALPISRTARHAADMLGLDPLTIANEGKLLAVVRGDQAEALLAACRAHPLGADGAIIGYLTEAQPPLVELISRAGGRRIIQRPYGEELPRIC